MNISKTTPEYQIGPFPWKATLYESLNSISISDARGSYSRAVLVYTDTTLWSEKDAANIVEAMNGTFGAGINPHEIPHLLEVFKNLLYAYEASGKMVHSNTEKLMLKNSFYLAAKAAIEKNNL